MHTKVESDGKNLFVVIPSEILEQVGVGPDQCVEINVSESTIILQAIPEEARDSNWERLVAVVHSEALELFEGDARAKCRWMTLPQGPLGGRKPAEMLRSEEDIDALRLLIGRLEHGSIP